MFLLLAASAARAAQPNSLFTDHVVLQRGVSLPVWGKGAPGEKVTVSIARETASCIAGDDGRWMAKLAPLQAGGPMTMSITGTNKIEVRDVYVGDVWVCGGQSNMERQLGPRPPQQPLDNWEQEAASADLPEVREYIVPERVVKGINEDASGGWQVCTPQTAPKFCAVGFFFARALHEAVRVPVGLVFTTWGGTTAESWMSREALRANPELADILSGFDRYVAQYPAAMEKYNKQIDDLKAQYAGDVVHAALGAKPSPTPVKLPGPPKTPDAMAPSRLYNSMVAPLVRFPIKGVIWYQGESNSGRGWQYRTLFPALIADWRAQWGEGDFPFLFVQIAPFRGGDPQIREAQLLTALHTPNTAMTVTTDIGDANDIHPPHKRPVGERLALAARALAYGEKIEYSGPVYDSAQAGGGSVTVHFAHAAGLAARGGTATGFCIAGADGKFVPADAKVSGTSVIVSAPAVPAPRHVRYGFINVPDGNLFNSAGLPASPFRTDWEQPVAPPRKPNPAPAARTDGTSPATPPAR